MTAPGTEIAASPPASASVVASVRDLRVHFRSKAGIVQAVDGVDFDIHDGETLGLVGETGCGKSVTARSFLRLVPMPPGIPVGGEILFRPRERCGDCGGDGCGVCDETGRAHAVCPACGGSGGSCSACGGTGVETVDLLSVPDGQLEAIRGNRIAMIFQDPGKALNPALTVRDQMAEVFYTHRTEEVLGGAGVENRSMLLRRHAALRTRVAERMILSLPPLRSRRDSIVKSADALVERALADTQIPNPANVMDRYPHELSGGMKQRVMIAQALACDPDLLIADEPTTALDVTVQARIMELIRDLQERHHTAVLYISHDLSLVRRICDRTAVMYAGRIAEVGDADEVFNSPQHPYTRGLINAIPSSAHGRGQLAAIDGTVPELIDPQPGCRFAGRCTHETAMCTSADPALTDLSDGRAVSCFIHHPTGTGVAPSWEAT